MSRLVDLPAVQLRAALAAREVSVEETVAAYLDQIEDFAEVNAMVTVDAEGALKQARAQDAMGPRAELSLFGLPVGIKDTHDTAGLRTTYGSVRHAEHVPVTDALHVQRMRAAGAIVLGKTNVPEYAAGSHSVNRVFGATRNPYALGRSAGGSSGGAAAALAARQVVLADGSDMGGSLRNPASFCNVVGMRPSPGVVPLHEATNLLTPLTTAGPMGRTVADVELLLSVISQVDPATPIAQPALGKLGTSTSLVGLRVAYAPTLGGQVPVDPSVRAVVERTVALLEHHGAHVTLDCPNLEGAADAFLHLRAAEFLAEWGDAAKADPGDFNERITWNMDVARSMSALDVLVAQEQQTRLMREAARFFANYDVLVAPVATVAPFPVEWDYPRVINGEAQHNYLEWMRAATLITMLGTPALSLPAGFTPDGLPVGVQLVSAFGADTRLLSIARAIETIAPYASQPPQQPATTSNPEGA